MLEKTLESPLDCKEIKPVNPKGNQLWIFIGRIDVEAEAPIFWPSDAKSQLIGKDPDAGKDWRQEKETTEDEMVGWHHRLDAHEFDKLWEMVMDRAKTEGLNNNNNNNKFYNYNFYLLCLKKPVRTDELPK